VRSERELLASIPERLDWLWFLGFDLDDEVPNHSVLSKARARWGNETFKRFFERIVSQCVQVGLVDGRKLFMDSCLVQANASNNSVVNTESLKRHLNKCFAYDEGTDSFICPAGERLTRRRFSSQRQQWEYTASRKTCSQCALQSHCTRSKAGRSLKRHLRQQALDKMLSQAESAQARRDRKTRQHLMERSFARGTRYGIKQARWRRLWRAEIQEYLTATIQNMVVLVRYLKEPLRAVAKALSSRADMAGGHHVDRQRMPGLNAIASLIRHIVGRRCAAFSRENAVCQLA
jgi:IS5 family transposase